MREMPANSVDLIATDPPYYKVKGDAWDRQWDTPAAFLAWFDLLAEQWQRILRPNGSLYTFAWPGIAAEIEVLIKRRFNVLQRITWAKPKFSTKAEMFRKSDMRSFFPVSEAIIFAEHKGADNMAKGEAGYAAKCDELRGFVFEPLRAYLAGERDRAGFTTRKVAEAFQKKSGSRTVTGMAGHWLERVQWTLPTAENYQWLRDLFGPGFLAREYEDLRREYEDLRREYEDLRRPFNVTADVPYTDVWPFPTVFTRKGKHPCQKPAAMMEHIISASSRPGAVVFDPFMGSGATGLAALKLGRRFIGMEADPTYFKGASEKLAAAAQTPPRELLQAALGLDLPDALLVLRVSELPNPEPAVRAAAAALAAAEAEDAGPEEFA
jgi:site-specific DNA-methyltransferase (adenine-specific)